MVFVLDDRHEYLSFASDCAKCKHLEGGTSCPAYPKGIPIELLSGEHTHRTIIEDQQSNIVFEPISF